MVPTFMRREDRRRHRLALIRHPGRRLLSLRDRLEVLRIAPHAALTKIRPMAMPDDLWLLRDLLPAAVTVQVLHYVLPCGTDPQRARAESLTPVRRRGCWDAAAARSRWLQF
ncbi:hypothetical protein A9K58_12770 [Stenotrophomonas maltophilia]|uniref:Uncharacterized protein n=1 Tax=Stenotrophomonas maltophilia TaxID=40324 RepID=A0A1A6XSV2_STEMA|nr:hypothetical protein A9K58_12770 [Stenotrophomonas maltophilia]